MAVATIANPLAVRTALDRGRDSKHGPRNVICSGDRTTAIVARRILVVDDSLLDRILVERLLRRDGHDVVLVENGAQGVQAAATGRFDVVFMDMQMPVMDGLSATRAIRALPAPACEVVVVALTTNTHADEVRGCFAAGMNAHLAKPAGRDILRSAIASLVRDTGIPIGKNRD